ASGSAASSERSVVMALSRSSAITAGGSGSRVIDGSPLGVILVEIGRARVHGVRGLDLDRSGADVRSRRRGSARYAILAGEVVEPDSATSVPARTFSTAARNSVGVNGLRRMALKPRRVASLRMSGVPYAVMRMPAIAGRIFLACARTSTPVLPGAPPLPAPRPRPPAGRAPPPARPRQGRQEPPRAARRRR